MKSIKKISLVLVCLVLISSCKKKSSTPAENTTAVPTPTPTSTVNGSMTAKLNGANWVSIRNTGALQIDTDNDISALVLNGETAGDIFALGIDFPTANLNVAIGNHDYGLTKDDAIMTYTKKTSGGGTLTQHFPDEGTFNITSVDNTNKKVSGTFSFKMHKVGSTASADSIIVTNGVFTNISYVVL